MAKIARAAGTENQAVGKVFILYGTVKAVSPDGTVRVLAPSSPIYADEHIITESDGSVSIQFDGPPVTQLDLGRMTEIVIDEDVYAGVAPQAVSEAAAEIEQVQESLLEGDKPIELEATAAGGDTGAGGGHTVFTLAPDGNTVTPVSGADTTGITTTGVSTTGVSTTGVDTTGSVFTGVGGPSIPLINVEVDNDATTGSGIHIDLVVSKGDVVTFNWSFDADDYTPFNDFGFAVIDGKAIKLTDISQVGSENAIGWRTFAYTATADGPLPIGFGVMNTSDLKGGSHLLIDKLAVNGAVKESFESGDLTGWDSIGNATVVTSHDEGGGTPTDGDHMAKITSVSGGSEVVSEVNLESFFGLDPGTMDAVAAARLGSLAWGVLDDEGLPHGIPGGEGDILVNPDPDYNEATFSGTLPHDFGPDGAGSITFAAMHGQTGLVGTEEVTYSWNATTGTLTATGPRGALFTVEVNPTTGDFTATLQDNVLHNPPVGDQQGSENNAYLQQLTYTVTDSDGDHVDGTLHIRINDDMPVAMDQTTSPVSGALGSFGADGGHVLSIAGVGGGTVDGESTAAAGDYDLQVTGKFGGTLKVDSSDGNYIYTPPAADGSGNKVNELFEFKLIDGDGDTASGQLSMLIDDPNHIP
jgi:hypothetical protein